MRTIDLAASVVAGIVIRAERLPSGQRSLALALALAGAARLAEMALGDFVVHLSLLGIAVVAAVSLDTDEVERDLDTLKSWLASP